LHYGIAGKKRLLKISGYSSIFGQISASRIIFSVSQTALQAAPGFTLWFFAFMEL
jgi:hypothetical protein